MGRANGSVYLAMKDFIELQCYLPDLESRIKKMCMHTHTHTALQAFQSTLMLHKLLWK